MKTSFSHDDINSIGWYSSSCVYAHPYWSDGYCGCYQGPLHQQLSKILRFRFVFLKTVKNNLFRCSLLMRHQIQIYQHSGRLTSMCVRQNFIFFLPLSLSDFLICTEDTVVTFFVIQSLIDHILRWVATRCTMGTGIWAATDMSPARYFYATLYFLYFLICICCLIIMGLGEASGM